MPAAPCGSCEAPLRFLECVGTLNPLPAPTATELGHFAKFLIVILILLLLLLLPPKSFGRLRLRLRLRLRKSSLTLCRLLNSRPVPLTPPGRGASNIQHPTSNIQHPTNVQ